MAAAVFSKEREAREKAEARALEAQRLAELEARIAQVPDSDIEHDAGIIEIEGQICAVDVLIDEVGGGASRLPVDRRFLIESRRLAERSPRLRSIAARQSWRRSSMAI